jgi:hypothetical protein
LADFLADLLPDIGPLTSGLLFPMATDHIRYDILAQEALRGVVRTVLVDAAKNGLPGDHHFKITFNTAAPGVRLSDRMRAQYPEAMTIILQHQFWDLDVGEDSFEVGLSFGGITERLAVPFEAITAFYDPSVQFGFQFETIEADAEQDAAGGASPKPAIVSAETGSPETLPASTPAETKAPASGPAGGTGGEVVRLDRFRKK